MTKRILGGIAWACAIALMQSAWGQYGPTYPNTPAISPPASPTFQPGLSSEEYLRLMEEANEARHASLATNPSNVQLAADHSFIPRSNTTPLPTAVPQTPTSVQPLVQATEGFSQKEGERISTTGHDPRFSVSMDLIWLRRGGDEGTSWSSGGALGGFGEDQAAVYRMGWYRNPMDRYEFAFLGSAVWNRYSQQPGPVDSLLVASSLQPSWFDSFEDSNRHEQSSTARLRSYELNRRWITDDLANYFIGLHMIDYRESYRLQSMDADGAGRLGLATDNVLAGVQGGLELWHPISQRLALGGQGILGLYGNFADGSWRVDVESHGGCARNDRKFQLAAGLGWDAKARYQITSRLQAFGGYRWWYVAGVATVDDQTIGPLASDSPFAMSTDAGFLLQGATCGLEIVF